ncbi:hypothetical protein CUMW_254600 [Citrus unshiu]|uniref:START domain-containing protein n=1 Tax=Citrus unshiu TaxID=55188 RepID=A0A2H5QRG4_CITUN|nr:hypothetical protein CUMW_254600 [Citrus unshiu]
MFPQFVWPRDLCYVRYWRRNDDGSYVVLFRSREHENCGPQPGYVRAHVESGGFNISPLKPRNGRPRTQVQHLMQIDLKGWGVGYLSMFQQHCLFQMLNSVAGLREWFAQTDERSAHPRIPVMVNMASASVSSKKNQNLQDSLIHPSSSLDQLNAGSRHSVMMDEYSDEDEEFQLAESEQEANEKKIENDFKRTANDLLSGLIDVDIGSSTVANGVLGLVIGVITTLVVDMAFLVQANTTDELPERLIGAVRVSHIELKSAVVPKLEPEIS